MALSVIVFDCDGVLIESVDAKTRAFRRVAEPYGPEAADRLEAYHTENGGVSRMLKFDWLFAEVLKRPPKQGEKEELADNFAEYCLDEVLHSAAVPGVLDVLREWHGRVPLYVASGAPHEELNDVLQQHGMAHFFEEIYGSPPGKAELLRRILIQTGVNPAEAVMVGDSSTDLYAAEAARCRFYGRGEYFRHTDYPWHGDLTRLNAFLREMAGE